MKTKIIFFSIISIFLSLESPSKAAVDFTRVGAYSGAEFSAASTAQGPRIGEREDNLAVGASLEAAISNNWGIETGIQATKERIQIPVFARLWGGKFFTIAAGPVADGISDDNDSVHIAAGLAAGFNFPVEKDVGIFVEGRAKRAFRDDFSNIDDRKTDAQALAGIRVALH